MSDPARLNTALEGRYRIERELGEGGMATVYLADDLRHERNVAIKVLKPELAAVIGGDRFLSEIKTTANLQHPHILPLFDSGEAEGFLFYVMPCVAGESLRERLDRETQLPIKDAVKIATSVANALDYAHRQEVIHRDIKPENILLHDGEPLVADFGIALAVTAAGGGRLTETGLSLGTPQYMSPEQASADPDVTGQSDVYALGAVLYEMLAGDPPHVGPNTQAVLSRVLTEDPRPVSSVRRSVPAHVAGVVAKALEKMPADRFETGGQLASSLQDEGFRWPQGAGVEQRAWKVAFAVAATVAAVATLLAVRGASRDADRSAAPPTTALSFFLPEDQLLDLVSDPSLVLSPDGTTLVYVGEEGRGRRLYVREVGAFGVRVLEGTEGARAPVFSPNGQSLAFVADGALQRVSIEGGIPSRVTAVPGPIRGASWGEDGTILYSLNGSSLWRVPAYGGSPTEIPLVLDTAGLGDGLPVPTSLAQTRWPEFLPGQDLALVTTSFGPTTLGVIDLTSGRFRPIGRLDRAHYLPSGHLVFYGGRERVGLVPFSLDRLEITGSVVPIVDDALRPAGSEGRFAVSESGTLAYPLGGFDRQLVIVDRDGRETPLDLEPRGYRFPDVSPTGDYVAVTVDPQPPQIWVVDLRRQNAQPVTSDGYNLSPAWSPDGTRLVFSRNAPGPTPFSIVWVPWPGGGEPTVVGPGGGPYEWSRANELFARIDGRRDLTIVNVETGDSTDLLATPAFEGYPDMSPDGDWVAYTSNVTGIAEAYVRAYAGGGTATQISNGGGTEPRWAPDGAEIFYRDGNSIMAVEVETSPGFAVTSAPTVLFNEPYDFSNDQNWDVLPDGRFVMVRSNPNIGHEVRLLFNWLDPLIANTTPQP